MIRMATPQDAPELEQIAVDAYSKYLSFVMPPPDPLFLDYDAVSRSGNTYVLIRDNAVCGMVTFTFEKGAIVLRSLAVKSTSQGKGCGRELACFVENQAIALGVKSIVLWTREEMADNISFYLSLGYEITHQTRDDECSRVYFQKNLTAAATA